MKTTLIICEYNPFHWGHLHHISETRKTIGETRLIALMSGNVVQRGDFPIISKFARTEMALQAGFDLVLQLPDSVVLSSAEKFAQGAVKIAENLGCVTHISFGAETSDISLLQEIADIKPQQYSKTMSLPAFWQEQLGDNAKVLTPNNILAIEYLRALKNTKISPVFVKRNQEFSSATVIRKQIFEENYNPKLIPFPHIFEREISQNKAPANIQNAERAVLYALRNLTDFSKIPDAQGGLYERIAKASKAAATLDELYHLAKTKRYTMSRIRRCVMCAFLEIENTKDGQIKILGIGKNGKEILHDCNKQIFRKTNTTDAKITDIFSLCLPSPLPSGWEYTVKLPTQ